jgi:hypothetical protein
MPKTRTPHRLLPLKLAVAAILLLAAPAQAVTVKGGHYAESKDNVIVVTFDVVGGSVVNFSHNDSCARFQVPVPRMKIGTGSFSFTGHEIENENYQEYSVRVSGTVVSERVIKGSMTYEKTKGNGPHCRVTTRFRATRTGRARVR